MTYILAHRGFSAAAPENTLASIKQAIEIGVDFIEIDIHLTKDFIPVVIHDPDVSRTSNRYSNLHIETNNYAELKNFDLGSWFHPDFHSERLPTLEEVLKLDLQGAKLMIEVKKDLLSAEAIVPHILKVAKKYTSPREIFPHYFGSFNPSIIKEIRKEAPGIHTIGILENLELIDTFLRIKVHTLAIWAKILNAEVLTDLKSKNVQVFSFTVNDPAKGQELIEMGVQGLITDNPAMMKQMIMANNRDKRR